MLAEALIYLDLLVFLAGTLLYGYLARELAFRPRVLPGNRALRGVAWALLVFYGGTLVDQQLFLLVGPRLHSTLGTALDILRGAAWLLVFPLLAGTLVHSARRFGLLPGRRRDGSPARVFVGLPWLGLLPLLPALWHFARDGEPVLAQATRAAYPWVVLHAVLGLGVSAYLAGRLATHLREERAMGRLLHGLQALLLGLLVFFLVTLAFDPWGDGRVPVVGAAPGLRLALRTAVMAALLLPGLLFAVFVRRYNVLRLSLSFRTLRHFFWVLVLVLVLMLAGPALGVADVDVYRRVVAWGLLVAVFAGAFYAPVADALLRRSPALRQLFGRSVSPTRLEALLDRLQGLDLPAGELLPEAARQLGRELSIHAAFLDAGDPVAEPFRRHFSDPPGRGSDRRPVHRLDPGPMAAYLARSDLQAVFPLRVGRRLEGLLALRVADSSPFGGGLDDGELEAVALVVRQLGAILASRRLMEARLGEERRMAEQERLSVLGLVAASLAHEVKNPLSSMKALAQALREDLASGNQGEPGRAAEGIADLDAILEQIDRLGHTTREILGLARPSPGEICDLHALAESAVYVLSAEARRRGVELAAEHEPVGEVPGSPAAWQTVIFNLVSNAIHHSPTGSRVSVRLGLSPNGPRSGIEFVVENPAPELAPGPLDALFELFHSRSQRGGNGGGTGLGLALVARRAAELGAHVAGRAEGGWAVFRVRLPASELRPKPDQDPADRAPQIDEKFLPTSEETAP